MALNFNVNPYYDDFDEDKNFHRILFRPGRAVQARELTQAQTILQNQIDRFGSHIFKEGSKVTGAETFDETVYAVKLQPTFGGDTIDISRYEGYYAKANSTNTVYYINKVDLATSDDPNILYLNFITKTTVKARANIAVANSETIAIYSTPDLSSSNLVANVITQTANTTTSVKLFSINEGIFFTNGVFVKNPAQSVVASKTTEFPNVSIGFDVTETIVGSGEDTTLLDPAVGASNYFAPGADRYKVSLTLATKDLIDDSIPDLTTEKYIEIARYRNGVLVKDTRAANYADLLDNLARRTYDESGNYRVIGLDPSIRNISQGNTFNLLVSPGKAYVLGFDNELIAQKSLSIEKARDTESVEGYDVPSYYGNYFHVTSANGAVFNFSTAQKVELHSANTGWSANTKIAEAYARNFEYVSGNGSSAVYKLSLFDVTKTSNTPISLTKTILNGNADSFTATSNIQSSSIFTRTTTATVTNNSSTMTVSNPTSITVGMEIFGDNVSSGTFVTSVDASQVTMSNNASGNTTSGVYVFQASYLTDTNYDSSVFEASYDFIKEFSEVNYDAKRVFKSVSFTAGVGSISTNDGTERFNPIDGANLQRNYAICIRTGGTGSFPNFTWVDLSGGSYISIPTPSPGSPATLNIDLGDATFNGTADVLATIDINGATRRTKTYVTGARKYFDQYTANTLSLGYSDVVNVTAIYISNDSANAANANANTNVVDSFVFDSGQRDSFYDHATITVKTGETVNTGNVLVIYNRFDHSGTGYFDTLSYPTYDTIPTYTKRDGTIIDLRDCLDFRPIRTANVTSNVANGLNKTFSSQQIVDSTVGSADTNLEYYLSRVDKVVMDKNGQFKVIKGTSALRNPPVPNDEPNAMTLYTLSMNPYTYSSSDVKIKIAKNKRYTMKDIGALDDRLTRVEYYTALNFLEQDVAKTVYYDDQDNQLFNNGFIVDSFRGHSIADFRSPDYKCSVDYDNEILHPRFESNGRYLIVTSNTLAVSSNTITLPYTTVPYFTQNVATGTINVNPFNVIGFIGYVKLEKPVISWADFESRPAVVINENGDSTIFEEGENYQGAKWGDWNILSSSQDSSVIYTYYSESGQRIERTTSARIKESDSAVIENKILFYTPNTSINFELFGMRPNTEIGLLVDNVNLTPFLRYYDSANASYDATALVTDKNGYVKGSVIIPNDDVYKFTVGKNHLFFTDNTLDKLRSTTLAETFFYSSNPPAVKPPQPVRESPESDVTGSWEPPVIPNDVVVTPSYYYDVESYNYVDNRIIATFAAAGQGAVSKNGNLGGIGGSEVWFSGSEGSGQTAASVSDAFNNVQAVSYTATSDIGEYATGAGAGDTVTGEAAVAQWYFDDLGRAPDYGGMNHWVAEIASGKSVAEVREDFLWGANIELGKCNASDPLAQSFFVNPYTNPNGIFVESIDIFFATKDETGIPVSLEIRPTVNGYPSSTEKIAFVTLNPDSVVIPADPNVPEATTFRFDDPVYLEPGEYSFVLLAQTQAYNVYRATIGEQRIDTGEVVVNQPYIGSLFKSQNASTWTADQDSDVCFILRQCKFTTSTAFSAVLNPESLGYNKLYDLIRLNIPTQAFVPQANVSFELATKANGSATLSNYFGIIPNSEVYLQNRKVFNTSADANVRIIMTTTDADISPVVRSNEATAVFVKNLLDSAAAANVTSFPETLPSGGGAESKYITRKVTLNEGFDATSLRVYLQQNLPAGSSFQVYYKVQSDTDSGLFDDKPWVQMTLNGTSTINQNINEYYDYEYRADNISYTSDDVTYDNFRTFAIKLVMFSTNPANSPTAKNFRAIALS